MQWSGFGAAGAGGVGLATWAAGSLGRTTTDVGAHCRKHSQSSKQVSKRKYVSKVSKFLCNCTTASLLMCEWNRPTNRYNLRINRVCVVWRCYDILPDCHARLWFNFNIAKRFIHPSVHLRWPSLAARVVSNALTATDKQTDRHTRTSSSIKAPSRYLDQRKGGRGVKAAGMIDALRPFGDLGTLALLVARRTNNRKTVGSMPAKGRNPLGEL